jgi:hypothetical protein
VSLIGEIATLTLFFFFQGQGDMETDGMWSHTELVSFFASQLQDMQDLHANGN